ncbi:thyroid transcription factor 1-associated protein 26 [Episyrphus balteatus]|uniref:thyroid transcription factor 1-associated protein 26 n=1 Tax=Episyrphus balteatus TaxID=286459 RepID=UPI002484E431|nr:thyroid transcription factor 1-associated protein 26 [Episyrphus balteatus]XP_055847124.1 thyroid transcription factor 1-associated protein 26 [Episyrphus balteatus]
MGNFKQENKKFNPKNKNTKNPPGNYKKQHSKDFKPKPKPNQNAKPKQQQPPRQNKGAEIIRQKKQAEKAEKERRIMEFKKKRLEKTKVISKKTSRGQPLMKDRMEYLLKQIQEMKKH